MVSNCADLTLSIFRYLTDRRSDPIIIVYASYINVVILKLNLNWNFYCSYCRAGYRCCVSECSLRWYREN